MNELITISYHIGWQVIAAIFGVFAYLLANSVDARLKAFFIIIGLIAVISGIVFFAIIDTTSPLFGAIIAAYICYTMGCLMPVIEKRLKSKSHDQKKK